MGYLDDNILQNAGAPDRFGSFKPVQSGATGGWGENAAPPEQHGATGSFGTPQAPVITDRATGKALGMRDSFGEPQDHPENGPVTAFGYSPRPVGDTSVWHNPVSVSTTPGPMQAAASTAVTAPVTVAASTSQPRPQGFSGGSADSVATRAGISRDGGAKGPVSAAASGDYTPATNTPNVSTIGSSPSIDDANRRAGAELNVIRANENAALDRQHAISDLGNRERQATFEGRNKAWADHVDQVQNRNLMEWQLNGNPRALAAYKGAVDGKGQGPVSSAAGIPPSALAGAAQTPYLQEALARNEAGSKSVQQELLQKQGAQQLQAGALGLEKGKIDLQNAQHISSLHQALSAAQTPEEQKRVSDQILLAAGHQPGPDWQVHAVGGGQVMSEMGVPVAQPQSIFAINTRTGAQMTFGGAQQPGGAAPQQSQFQTGKVYTDAKGNRATWDGTKFVEAK
jgi:hypothetical protein